MKFGKMFLPDILQSVHSTRSLKKAKMRVAVRKRSGKLESGVRVEGIGVGKVGVGGVEVGGVEVGGLALGSGELESEGFGELGSRK